MVINATFSSVTISTGLPMVTQIKFVAKEKKAKLRIAVESFPFFSFYRMYSSCSKLL